MQHLHLLLVVGHAVNESHSTAGIVGKLAHIEQILWIFLLLVVALDPFMLLGAMLLVLETQKILKIILTWQLPTYLVADGKKKDHCLDRTRQKCEQLIIQTDDVSYGPGR